MHDDTDDARGLHAQLEHAESQAWAAIQREVSAAFRDRFDIRVHHIDGAVVLVAPRTAARASHSRRRSGWLFVGHVRDDGGYRGAAESIVSQQNPARVHGGVYTRALHTHSAVAARAALAFSDTVCVDSERYSSR